MALPRFVGLQSLFNKSYLFYLDEDVNGCLLVRGEEVTSPTAKFAVEPAKSSTTLVHIRCCYNNKYLRKMSDDEDSWIVARADKHDENQKNWSCTLFEPVWSNSKPNQIMYFRHAQKSKSEYLSIWIKNDTHYGCLYTTTTKPEDDSAWAAIDLEAILILPKHIALSNVDNKFLSAVSTNYWKLSYTGTEVGNLAVGNSLVTNTDGSISIKSNYANKFWGTYDSNIYADCEFGETQNCRFWPVLIDIDTKVIALRMMDTNKFCYGDYQNFFNNLDRIAKKAYLVVSEPVLCRLVYDVDYRLSDARIYNEVVDTVDTGIADNQTDQTVIVGVTLKYTVESTTSWNNSIMAKLGITASINASIPLVGEGKVEVTAEISGSYQWGGNVYSKDEIETNYQVVVPPNTKVKVSLLATKGSFEVPFSYVQRDTLCNGKRIITRGKDGVYKGDCCYKFTYESEKVETFNHIPNSNIPNNG